VPPSSNAAGEVQRGSSGAIGALASVADETPEGSRCETGASSGPRWRAPDRAAKSEFVAFSAQTRMSGIDVPGGRAIRKGAPDAVIRFVRGRRGKYLAAWKSR